MRTLSRIVPLLVAGLLLLGCGGADEPAETDPDPDLPAEGEPGDHPEDTPSDEVPDEPATDDLDALASRIAVEVAEDEGVDEAQVRVVSAEEVTWPDGALGCPEEDGMYTQALVDGYRIVVEVDGREHHYHGATGQLPFRCDDPQPPVED